MKSSNFIINHLTSNPYFYKLKESNCLRRLKESLPNRISNLISFIYVKNDTLFIALSHAGAKMELNNDYNISLIKRLLKIIEQQDSECKKFTQNKIKFFITNKSNSLEIKNDMDEYKNIEKAKGYFINQSKNENLREVFEDIRKNIINNKNT